MTSAARPPQAPAAASPNPAAVEVEALEDVPDFVDDWPKVPVLEDHHFLTEPMESERHLIALLLFYQLMKEAFGGRDDVYVGADLVVYFSELQVRNKDFRAPDGVVVVGVEPRERKGWIVWEEDGRYPDLVVEHMSPSTRKIDLGVKFRIYGQIWKVKEYFAFDLESGEIHAFRGTVNNGLERMEPNAAGRYPSKVLAAEIGVSDGVAEGRPGPWMRLFSPDGSLVLTRSERAETEAARAETEAARAESEAARAESEAAARALAEARVASLEAELAALKATIRPG